MALQHACDCSRRCKPCSTIVRQVPPACLSGQGVGMLSGLGAAMTWIELHHGVLAADCHMLAVSRPAHDQDACRRYCSKAIRVQSCNPAARTRYIGLAAIACTVTQTAPQLLLIIHYMSLCQAIQKAHHSVTPARMYRPMTEQPYMLEDHQSQCAHCCHSDACRLCTGEFNRFRK